MMRFIAEFFDVDPSDLGATLMFVFFGGALVVGLVLAVALLAIVGVVVP